MWLYVETYSCLQVDIIVVTVIQCLELLAGLVQMLGPQYSASQCCMFERCKGVMSFSYVDHGLVHYTCNLIAHKLV